jgi:hypothetical protein
LKRPGVGASFGLAASKPNGEPVQGVMKNPASPHRAALRRAYALMRRHFGHQNWWPGESPFEVCVGAILTKHFCRTRKPLCETWPLKPLLPDSK